MIFTRRPSRKQTLLIILATLLIAAGAALTIFIRTLDIQDFRDDILAAAKTALRRDVSYQSAQFSMQFGPSLAFKDVVIKEKDGTDTFVSARRLTFRLAILPLINKKLVLKDIYIDNPVIHIRRAHDGTFNISDLLEEQPETATPNIKGIKVNKGFVDFTDKFLPEGPQTTTLQNTDFSITELTRGKDARIKFSTSLTTEGQRALLSFSGKIRTPEKGRPLGETFLNLDLAATNLNFGKFWPYYRTVVPFRQMQGKCNSNLSIKGTLNKFTAKYNLSIAQARLDYPAAFVAPIAPPQFQIVGDISVSPHEIDIPAFSLKSSILNVKGEFQISGIDTKDPKIRAKAITTQPFNFRQVIPLIPYPIIAKDAADFIKEHIKDGNFRLDEGRLEGRVSQIAHMEKGENYNVLSIKGRSDKAVLDFGDKIPRFTEVSGPLQLSGKDFILSGMSGKFGNSPFTMSGRITDYPLETPCSYPFTMIITPSQSDTAWLLGEWKSPRLVFTGNSTLKLSGSGQTSAFNLKGEWDLTQAAYTYHDQLSKPAGRANTLSVNGTLNGESARITALQYNLSPLVISATGKIDYHGKVPVSFALKTTPFRVNDVAPHFPSLKKYQPSGRLQASVQGETRDWSMDTLMLKGEVTVDSFAFKPADDIKAISNISGSLRFKGDSLESSNLVAIMGNSVFHGKGSLKGFSNPVIALSFSSPHMELSDLGLSNPEGDVKLKKISGAVTYKDNQLFLKEISATINSTPLSVSGLIQDSPEPRYEFTINSSNLTIEDLSLLAGIEKIKKSSAQPTSPPIVKATIHADGGRFKDIPFKKLQATINQERNIMYIDPLNLQFFNGKASGKVRIDKSLPTSPRYQVSFSIDKVSCEQFITLMDSHNKLISGTLSLTGDLTAKGQNSSELKKTALGNIHMRIEEGTIKRFPILSKIFSILNVYQLLKLQLPDMVSGGMPYNTINAGIGVKDGIMSTTDLFISSNAMNISAVGSVDSVHETLDMKIGVKPLQTVDRVVSNIPIIGWVLTGKDKTLITAYFEAKGDLKDPKVTAIPIQSLSKGVLGIFSRILQLPAKIVTNTGEVIIGK